MKIWRAVAFSGFAIAILASAYVIGQRPLAAEIRVDWQSRYAAPLQSAVTLAFPIKPEWYGRPEVAGPDFGDHPCGGYGMRRVERVPDFPESQPLTSVPATEIVAGHRSETRWRLPLDNRIWAVAGDWRLVSFSSSDGPPLWVHRDGRLMASRNIPQAWMQRGSQQCPGSTAVPGADTYCAALPDLADGRSRTIEGDAVCT